MSCPYRNHQNSLKSSQFYLLHVFYTVQFSGNWRVKPKWKAAATTKSLGTIKASTIVDMAISLVAELVTPSCHLRWQCVIVNFSTITVFPVGSNTIWNNNYTSTKTSLLKQEKNKSFRSSAAFIFVSDNCFNKSSVDQMGSPSEKTNNQPKQRYPSVVVQASNSSTWQSKPEDLKLTATMGYKRRSRLRKKKLKKSIKKNASQVSVLENRRLEPSGLAWAPLMWPCSHPTQPVTCRSVSLPMLTLQWSL